METINGDTNRGNLILDESMHRALARRRMSVVPVTSVIPKAIAVVAKAPRNNGKLMLLQ